MFFFLWLVIVRSLILWFPICAHGGKRDSITGNKNRILILLKTGLICALDFLVKIFSPSLRISKQANESWFINYAGHLSSTQSLWYKSKHKFGRPAGFQKIECRSVLLMFSSSGVAEYWFSSKTESSKDIGSATSKQPEHSKNQKPHKLFSCFPPLINTRQNFFFKLVRVIEFQFFMSEIKISVSECYFERWNDSWLRLLWRFVVWNICAECFKSIESVTAMPLNCQLWNRDLSPSQLVVFPSVFVFWCWTLNLILRMLECMFSI